VHILNFSNGFLVDQKGNLAPLVERWEKRSPLTAADRHALMALPHQVRAFNRDQYLVREGDEPKHCCLLLDGFAYRHKLTGDGARQIISIHMRGEFVDLQNALLSVADHHVQTLTRAVVTLIPQQALSDLMAERPNVGRAMWVDTLIDSSIFREWVVNVGRRDAQARIAHLLCELSLRMEAAGLAEGHVYDLPLTQAQLADATGLTSVHVNRVLKTLREEGLIELDIRSLRIIDWEGMRKVGDFGELYLHQHLQEGRSG
jgi:CRP-like cAMP-binding protein